MNPAWRDRRGYRAGSRFLRAYAAFNDVERTRAYLEAQGFPASEIDGAIAYESVFERARVALRKGERDSWLGSSPTRGELEEMLG